MSSRTLFARALASSFLAGAWSFRAMRDRGIAACGEPPFRPARPRRRTEEETPEVVDFNHGWVLQLAFDVRTRWASPPLHEFEALVSYLDQHPAFDDAWHAGVVSARPRLLEWHAQMRPARWPVRELHTLDDVGEWLGFDDGQLKWFADRRGLLLRCADERLQHYTRRWVARGERLPRLLEAPKLRLKAVQRKLLDEVLAKVPAHDAAHGFVKGRSVMTQAAIHAGQRLVVRFDLIAFFTWLQPLRAYRLFRTLGYTHEVASVLLGLCTTRTPQRVLRAAPRPAAARLDALFDLRRRLADWHLPQGAPTSPALANLTCWSLDTRLQAWAERAGLVYSRYADDLVFSGGSTTGIAGLSAAVSAICRDEGFRVNDEKTRVMRVHGRQEVTGLVVNQGVAVSRAQRDALKAQLFNLAHGRLRDPVPSVPALRAQLEGQVSWVEHAHAGRPLKKPEVERNFRCGVWVRSDTPCAQFPPSTRRRNHAVVPQAGPHHRARDHSAPHARERRRGRSDSRRRRRDGHGRDHA